MASLVTAFIAGVAALFAPCCITVLLPAYLGSIFRQKATIMLMTFVFFAGLLAVFLPLGLGFAALGVLFSKYHNLIFVSGGVFLLLLGASTLLGMHFSLPSAHPKMKVQDAASVFVLGVFSAFATLCCAPVLAGVLALSILPGSVFWGGLYALAYVLGMIFPLFILAYFVDKSDLGNRLSFFKKQVSYFIAKKKIEVTIAEMIAGIMFLLMGTLILYLAKMGKLAMSSDYQVSVNIFMANLTTLINSFFVKGPLVVWFLFAAAVLLALIALIKRGKGQVD
ncbi:MAG TPA: cytochrome c biogenesis protein CcdA [Candidatus Nanoarchaeia archaeon]|nr:cytochrome c biogenesis protein CcdA [Candidatus Nanoarchaeia archaeon]